MISGIAALVLSTTLSSPAVEQQAAAQKVITMIKKYQNKLCANGNITWTVQSPKDSLKVRTDFQYLRPNKIWILQQSVGGSSRKSGTIVCDGKYFVYRPDNKTTIETRRDLVKEPVREARTGRLLTIDEIFIIGSTGLLDRSVPLDIVMGRLDNVDHLDRLLGDVKPAGEATVNGKECDLYSGKMRRVYNADPTIPYTLAISKSNELIQMKTVETIMGENKQAVTFHMTWDVSVTLNDEKQIQQKFFALPR